MIPSLMERDEMLDILQKEEYGYMPVYTTHKSYIDFIEDLEGVIDYNKTLGSNICGLGMCLGYHNHSIEFAPIDGKTTIFDRMVNETNPENFRFILDTYWLQVGDYTIVPAEWQNAQMTEVGSGNLDWDAIIKACEESEVQYCIVEQDRNHIDDDPFKALASSYEYLTLHFFMKLCIAFN